MSAQLKIKIKSLAAEAAIIRHEERKAKASARWARKNDATQIGKHETTLVSLSEHRRQTVRGESRHSLLAYGFLRGTPYRAMEALCKEDPDWGKVEKIAERFGGGTYGNEFTIWKDDGYIAGARAAHV